MKKVLFAIILATIFVSCKSSQGCGCPNPYGYIKPNTQNNHIFMAEKMSNQ